MIKSINPYTNEIIEKFKQDSKSSVNKKVKLADKTFQTWSRTNFERKKTLMLQLAKELKQNKKDYALAITREMGKPITQAIAEIEKCAWLCEYYANNAESQLQSQEIKTDASKSYVRFDPLGVIFAVMPWNYPFWQVFRFAVPSLMAGNVCLLKHSSNVMRSAENIQQAFKNAGFPEGCFQNLIIKSSKVEDVIRNKRVKAVTLTGSKPAGSSVASIAAEEIKKSVLELGGSNALVVFEDADIDKTIKACVQARFQNTGQSCIAGKRLLIHESIYLKFIESFITEVRELKSGNPEEEDTYIGVMATEELAKELEEQLKSSIDKGAKVILGGKRNKAYFEPTVVINVNKKSPIFEEETFGPVMAVTSFKTDMEALDLVNRSKFGLGVSIFTEDLERAKAMIPQIEDGAVFINELVKSDPRLPFGGTKESGFGRELSSFGIHEFINKKTVYIK
ncbi:succinate-semialdehyde dehydrogenase/glutarate-semialdehyde dehydrogenase [Mesonia algae]|uniref:Succinate-semialdehyde dehydrogenase/glutarate-semialdehyde dehydrogenase n=1 Tax=Mesonia algae TaxID=213248 RepID=A0A2W7I6A8_9FLAO|nr:NAD-dependent succinate-semialdehyde dehydrogenase [Mesonia algae]PZW42421.1 succinate-semialdehyde dehydrogenase/glutarate-semialdehyde dehydrogenase [Mesonia algae]